MTLLPGDVILTGTPAALRELLQEGVELVAPAPGETVFL